MSNVKKWENADRWVKVDLELCVGAGVCVDVCPASVYEVVDGQVQAEDIGNCVQCGACQGVCPNTAILQHWAWI